MDAGGDNRMLPWVFFRLVLLYFSCPATLNIAAGQELCRVPAFPPPNSNDNGAIGTRVQVIIPTMKFSGCGVIQTWTVYGRGTGGIGPGLQLQVFQPNPTRASVYTKVASTSVITAGNNLKSHTFGQLDLTFSPGNVLGFFYHNTDAFVEVHHTNSFSTHYILTSSNAQLSPTVTVAANRVSKIPRISVSVMCSACTPGEGNGPTTTSSTTTTTTATTTTTTATTMTSAAVTTSTTMTSAAATTSTTVTTATSTVPTIGSPESTSSAAVSPTPSSILIEPAGTSTERPSGNEGLVAAVIVVLLVLVSAGVVACVVIAVLVVLRRKKRRSKEDRIASAIYEAPAIDGDYQKVIVADHPQVYYSHVKSTTINSVSCLDGKSYYEADPSRRQWRLPNQQGGGNCESLTESCGPASPYLDPVSGQGEVHYECLNLPELNQQPQQGPPSGAFSVEPGYHDYQDVDQATRGRPLPPESGKAYSLPRLYDVVPTVEKRNGGKRGTMQPTLTYMDTPHATSLVAQLDGAGLGQKALVDAVYNMSHCSQESFLAPSSKEEEIYAQMAQWGYQEIPRSSVNISNKLGEGQFGEVYQAELKALKSSSFDVAVKLVKKSSPPDEKTKLLQEAATLGQFKHRHVVRLIGVVTVGEPKMMVMEMLPGGDLSRYLRALRKNSKELGNPDLPSLLLQFCKQVVDGLACLARKGFVHRDIAARNILLDKILNCKISDFGMSRQAADDNYYILNSKGQKLPARWMAPEAIFYKKYSTSSDVWSYGMLMYEIWSVGHSPFEKKTINELTGLLHAKFCQPPPPGCPRAVYEVMVDCWHPSHNERPSAADIAAVFCRSEKALLSWKEEETVPPSSQLLGRPLKDGGELYKDLQNMYYSSS